MMKKEICIVIPTLNEETSIGKVIDEIPLKALEDLPGIQLIVHSPGHGAGE